MQPDFGSGPAHVRLVTEAERLSFGHLYNPAFATEISQIDPLPHQRIAVYERMLPLPCLRFLLADDAGAGKTIMSGLYIREMLARRLIHRVLVLPPAGLVGNWKREMSTLFSLDFRIVSGPDGERANPFEGPDSDLLIVSIDTLCTERMFGRLQEPAVEPYDLVIFDEAHKLSADQEGDLTLSRTLRYRLAEALSGVASHDERWRLDWSARHVLLLTATPHMGKDYPYYCLWRLLDPDAFPTFEAFESCPASVRERHFIRRSKEEMVRYDGTRIYPDRQTLTFSYDLTQGPVSEQALYDQTTEYLDNSYNKAAILDASAAKLALSVFQRRLASSTYALMMSLIRRRDRLRALIADIEAGNIDAQQLRALEREATRLALDEQTPDEEDQEGGIESGESDMRNLEQRILSASLEDLEAESVTVASLAEVAREVYEAGYGSKCEELLRLLRDPERKDEKAIIFTEHRDTLSFVFRALEENGYTGRVTAIHGGMDFREREEAVERFRRPVAEGGAQYLVATDAAGEGINLQFCWLMINYDIPWNPARLEQRMGRIHRYGQKHDPVFIFNLLAAGTRDGKVMGTLLEKLQTMRNQLQSDKVFDVVGRMLEGISMRDLMQLALTDVGAEQAARELGGRLTQEQYKAVREREQKLYSTGGDVARELPRLRAACEGDLNRRLLPGYVQRFTVNAMDALDVDIEPRGDGTYALRPRHADALAPLTDALERYRAPKSRSVCFQRQGDPDASVLLHPGEPVFERIRALVMARMGDGALRGAVFLDPRADRPSLFMLCRVSVVRNADERYAQLKRPAVLDTRLIGVRMADGQDCELCPPEQLLLLVDGTGIPPEFAPFAARASAQTESVLQFARQWQARELANEHRERMLAEAPDRIQRLDRALEQDYVRLLEVRRKVSDKAKAGDVKAQIDLSDVRSRLSAFAERKASTLEPIRREPELVAPGEVDPVATALIVPTQSEEARRESDARIEAIAMERARTAEEAEGASVFDVSTPAGARAKGLQDHPGYDLLSERPDGEIRSIEVKGRIGMGEVVISENEWSAACNLRERYWLYAVFHCDSPAPTLQRVPDPFGKLLVKHQGVRVAGRAIVEASID